MGVVRAECYNLQEIFPVRFFHKLIMSLNLKIIFSKLHIEINNYNFLCIKMKNIIELQKMYCYVNSNCL